MALEENDPAPTLQLETPASSLDSTSGRSGAPVGVVAGARPKFSAETAQLLRTRLTAYTLVTSIVLAFGFVVNLLSGAPMIAFRIAVLGVFVGVCLLLRSKLAVSLTQLRFLELASLGALAAQITLMSTLRIRGFAEVGDAGSAIASANFLETIWCITILSYGIFIPNTWKRALAVLLPLCLLHFSVVRFLAWQSESVADALAADHLARPLPAPLVAVLVAVYGTNLINSVRREAFKARQLGQYRLKEKLGEGGMGAVYRGEHRMLKRPCAIKVIPPESEAVEKAIERFEAEVQSTAKLSHWNSVEVFDYGRTDDGTFYYVMEYLPGRSLEDLLKRHGPMPPERVVHFLSQTCAALAEAHSKGLVHRDIKPGNIFAAQRGGIHDVAKLLDFGLVRSTVADQQRAEDDSPRTFSGTPSYMAPEQAVSYDQVDARCDIYALGAVAYHLLTGRPPFRGSNVREILRAHAREDIPNPSARDAGIPADLDKVVVRCLAKDPADRFQTAAELREALLSCKCARLWTEQRAERWWRSRNAN